jgi:hypothetical protein
MAIRKSALLVTAIAAAGMIGGASAAPTKDTPKSPNLEHRVPKFGPIIPPRPVPCRKVKLPNGHWGCGR